MGPDDADVVIGIAPGTDDPSDELHRYARVLSFGVFLTGRNVITGWRSSAL